MTEYDLYQTTSCYGVAGGIKHSTKSSYKIPTGLSFAVYTDSTSCSAATTDNILEAFSVKYNYCYRTLGNDIKFTSCDNYEVNAQYYPSQDGTCVGAATSYTTEASSFCGEGFFPFSSLDYFTFTGSYGFFCHV